MVDDKSREYQVTSFCTKLPQSLPGTCIIAHIYLAVSLRGHSSFKTLQHSSTRFLFVWIGIAFNLVLSMNKSVFPLLVLGVFFYHWKRLLSLTKLTGVLFNQKGNQWVCANNTLLFTRTV